MISRGKRNEQYDIQMKRNINLGIRKIKQQAMITTRQRRIERVNEYHEKYDEPTEIKILELKITEILKQQNIKYMED